MPRVTHTASPTSARIRLPGLGRAVRVLHISDSHIAIQGEADAPYREYSARMGRAYVDRNPLDVFRRQVESAREDLDLLALTGDQVNFPSPTSVAAVSDIVSDSGYESVFIAGNHDWHYEGMPGSSDALRRTWRERALLPLYRGRDPHAATFDLHGIRFIAIDNATWQVDEEQLAFFTRHAECDLPLVLLIHIPLALPPLRDRPSGAPLCGDPAWGAATDRNWEVERRERWPDSGNLPSTTAFYDRVTRASNLVAVLCGHIHTDRVDPIHENACQYIVTPGYDGGSRLFTFEPA